MSAALSLHIAVAQEPEGWLGDLAGLLSRLAEAVEKPVDLIDLVNRCPHGAGAVVVQTLPADGAGERRIILEPSERLRELMTALRAWELVGDVVAESHPGFLIGDRAIDDGRAEPVSQGAVPGRRGLA